MNEETLKKIKEKSPDFYDSATLTTVKLLQKISKEENNGIFVIIIHETGQLIINSLDVQSFAQILVDFFRDCPEYESALKNVSLKERI